MRMSACFDSASATRSVVVISLADRDAFRLQRRRHEIVSMSTRGCPLTSRLVLAYRKRGRRCPPHTSLPEARKFCTNDRTLFRPSNQPDQRYEPLSPPQSRSAPCHTESSLMEVSNYDGTRAYLFFIQWCRHRCGEREGLSQKSCTSVRRPRTHVDRES